MLLSKFHGGLMRQNRMQCASGGERLWSRAGAGFRKPPGFRQPAVKPLYALTGIDLRRPPRRSLELPRVRDVVALVGASPCLEMEIRPLPVQHFDKVEQLEQTDRVPETAADVECFSRKRVDVGVRQKECIDQIVREQQVAHLTPIAINDERFP